MKKLLIAGLLAVSSTASLWALPVHADPDDNNARHAGRGADRDDNTDGDDNDDNPNWRGDRDPGNRDPGDWDQNNQDTDGDQHNRPTPPRPDNGYGRPTPPRPGDGYGHPGAPRPGDGYDHPGNPRPDNGYGHPDNNDNYGAHRGNRDDNFGGNYGGYRDGNYGAYNNGGYYHRGDGNDYDYNSRDLEAIARRIERAFRSDRQLRHARISTEIVRNTIELQGNVRNPDERQRAVNIARDIAHGAQINGHRLQVRY